MVAAGNAHGEVTIFQIQKELPTELVTDKLAAALIKSKPIERYTIKDACRGPITCVEWSKNGMKLFSGDSHGIVVLTEFDFTQHISKSMEVINEKFAIVQMQFSTPWLLISTLYRAIVCRRNDETNRWNVSQIGRTDRKVLNDFGAVFTPIENVDRHRKKPPQIICARPGFRFWLADCIDGNVSRTFLLKDSVAEAAEVPLLNPVHNKVAPLKDAYFGPCWHFMGKFIVTYCDTVVFIVDLNKLKVMTTIRRLRKIQYLSVNGNEIFIVEGGRSVVRISTSPEQHQLQQQQGSGGGSSSSTQYVALNHHHHNNNNNLMSNEANIEIQEETIAQADECFELPPIEQINLDIPLACRIGEHNILKEDKLLLEHSRKLEVFEKINTLDYDDSILFQTGTKKKKKTLTHSSPKSVAALAAAAAVTIEEVARTDGVVEIGRQAELLNSEHDTNGTTPSLATKPISENESSFSELTTKPCLMLASYCDGISNIQEAPVENGSSTITASKSTNHIQSEHKKSLPKLSISQFELSYPNYSIASSNCLSNANGKSVRINGLATTEAMRIPFNDTSLTSDDGDDCDNDDDDAIDSADSLNAIKQCANNHTPTKLMPSALTNPSPSRVIDHNDQTAKLFPNLSNLPKLWDMKIDKCDENQYNGHNHIGHATNGSTTKEGIESEWVFL